MKILYFTDPDRTRFIKIIEGSESSPVQLLRVENISGQAPIIEHHTEKTYPEVGNDNFGNCIGSVVNFGVKISEDEFLRGFDRAVERLRNFQIYNEVQST